MGYMPERTLRKSNKSIVSFVNTWRKLILHLNIPGVVLDRMKSSNRLLKALSVTTWGKEMIGVKYIYMNSK